MTLDDLAKLAKKRDNRRVLEVLEERAASPIIQTQFVVGRGSMIIGTGGISTGNTTNNQWTVYSA